MCRHLAYVGDPMTLADALTTGPTSLERQSFAPRLQRHGTVNADGWGVGWYPEPLAPRAARHRSAQPIWADPFLPEVAPHITSTTIVAAVRSATPPAPVETSGAAPFTDGRLLFSLNGAVERFADGVGAQLRRTLAPDIEAGIVGASDSEVVFACLRQAVATGSDLADATVDTIRAVRVLAEARLNLLVAEPDRVLATAAGDTLFLRRSPTAVWLASEPLDDDPTWHPVDDGSLVVVPIGPDGRPDDPVVRAL